MPNRNRPTTSTALLDTLTDSAALPALVDRLDPRELKRLVDTVGIEDAGALVVHANSTQLAHLVDESVWASSNPGDPETLSVAQLLRWFELWLDIGDGFGAEKLLELGEGFSALVFAKLVTVNAVDLAPGEVDEFSQAIGEYLVRARFEDEWDTIQATLMGLWDDYPDFLEAVFARLSFRHSILGIGGENDTQRVLEADAGHERESRKEAAGFVAATTAGAFLSGAAAADLDALVDEDSYDAETSEYFKRQARVSEPVMNQEQIDEEDEEEIEEEDSLAETEAELDELERELERYEVLQGEHVALLTGPPSSDGSTLLPIRRALVALAADPECLRVRSDELAYLSNLVMAEVRLGHSNDDENMSESDAANLVMSTCNLGGSYALWADAREAEEDADQSPFIDMLSAEPGLVRLFRIGWNLTRQLPVQAATRLFQALSAAPTTERLEAKPWLAAEIESLLGEPSFVEVVRAGDFDQAKETVQVLTIALEPVAVTSLCLLIDEVPRLAEILDGGGRDDRDEKTVTEASRYIASMKDLLLVDRFLGQLTNLVRV